MNIVTALLMLTYVALLVASGFVPVLWEHQEALLVHIVPSMMFIIAAGYVVRSWVRAGSAFISTSGPVTTPPIVDAMATPPAPERTPEQVDADSAQWRKTLLTLILVVSCAAILTAVAGALIT